MPDSERATALGVPSTYVLLLFEYLAARGVDAEEVLEERAPEPGSLGLARVSGRRWRRMLERASSHLDDPLLGLRVGKTITPSHAGVLGRLLVACDTLGDVFDRYTRYERLFYDVDAARTSQDDGLVRIEWGEELGRGGPLVDECAIAAFVQFARDVTGDPLPLVSISFVNRAPSNRRPYAAHFGCPVRFEASTTAIVCAASALALPLVRPDALLREVLDRQATALLAERTSSDDVERALRRALPRLLRSDEATVESAAIALRLSTRTLNRRLEAKGTSFREALDASRRAIACGHLRSSRLSMAEIAEALGYSDQSAFTRAFARWTGMSPSAWKRRHVR